MQARESFISTAFKKNELTSCVFEIGQMNVKDSIELKSEDEEISVKIKFSSDVKKRNAGFTNTIKQFIK